jgi:AcrR family transcriptional regulator
LTREAIAEAALRQLDERGPHAFSVRRLAADLGVTATATYWHARDRREVLDWVVELVLEGVEAPGDGPWDERAAGLLRLLRRRLLEHPNAIDLLHHDGRYAPAIARVGNDLLVLVVEGGFEGDQAVQLFWHLLTHLMGSLAIARAGAPVDPAGATSQALAAVPPERLAAGMAPYFFGALDRDDLFEQGIRLILSSLPGRRAG